MNKNYSVQSVTVVDEAGDEIANSYPTLTMVITPDPGWEIDATNFVSGQPTHESVDSVAFVQDEENVNCVVTFDPTYIMPFEDLNIPIDVDGFATLKTYSIAGTYELKTENTNLVSNPSISYSGSGNYRDVIELFTLTITADADHIFEIDPLYDILDVTTLPDNYSISRADTFNVDNELTQVVYTVMYELTDQNITGDKLLFTAYAEEQLVIGTPYINSYSLKTSLLKDGDTYYKNFDAANLVLYAYGDVGANFTVTLFDGTTTTVLYNNVELTLAGGYYPLSIPLPAVVTPTTFTITFSGDIDPGFAQPNPIVIEAREETTATITAGTLTGYTLLVEGISSVSGVEGPVAPEDRLSKEFRCFITIQKDDSSNLQVLKTASWRDVSNTDPLTNGGTEILKTPSFLVISDGGPLVSVVITGIVEVFGDTDVTLEFDPTGLVAPY